MLNPRQTPLGLLALVIVVMTSGCVSAPTPQAAKIKAQTLPAAWQSSIAPSLTGAEPATYLLDLVEGDDQLRRWLGLALEGNPDLHQTALRLAETTGRARQSKSQRLPEVSAGFQPSRRQIEAGADRLTQTDHSLSLSFSWEIDLWGRLADAARAASHDVVAAEWDLASARRSLAAQVMKRWVDLAVTRHILDTETERLASLRQTEATITERFQAGIGSLDDLDTTRSSIAATESNIRARQGEIDRSARSLSILIGQLPTPEPALPGEIPGIGLAIADLPVETLGRRADVLAAYHRVLAADARVEQAYKDLLPKFSLSATVESSDSSLSSVFRQSPLWSLLGNLSGPIFNAGRLRAEAEIQGNTAERLWWAYRQTLLNAVLEVEDGLDWELELERRESLLQESSRLAQAGLTQARNRYRDGLSEIVTLLVAERSAFDARVQWLEIRRNRLNRRIDLGLALGLGA